VCHRSACPTVLVECSETIPYYVLPIPNATALVALVSPVTVGKPTVPPIFSHNRVDSQRTSHSRGPISLIPIEACTHKSTIKHFMVAGKEKDDTFSIFH